VIGRTHAATANWVVRRVATRGSPVRSSLSSDEMGVGRDSRSRDVTGSESSTSTSRRVAAGSRTGSSSAATSRTE